MILLDTNIVSEMMKPTGDGNVRRWMDSYSELDFFIPTPVIAELRFGLALLPEGRKKDVLTKACDAIEDEIF
ncbi:MAG: PIN domain-containing protein, partial [Methylocystis sp.]